MPSPPATGTLTPQSKSRVTALGCKPPSIQLLHWPTTAGRQSFTCSFKIHSRKKSSCLFKGKYQWVVSFLIGALPLKVLTGLINSSGLKLLPHFSHWSPYASGCPQLGQVPLIYLSAKKLFAAASKYCNEVLVSKSPLASRSLKNALAVSWCNASLVR